MLPKPMYSWIRWYAVTVMMALFWRLLMGPMVGVCADTNSESNKVMRPFNLDYLDADTMEYYLQSDVVRADYDLAVLFYAQWCKNCHAFAPIWDKISRLIHAGSKESNLIMALFDCEKDARHVEVCNQAGVKHYPTITFFSLSGQVFHRRQQQKKNKKNHYVMPKHASQFAGNWQYGDAVYDWIRTMSALSKWHRSQWGQKLRSFFSLNNKKYSKKNDKLPLGIPDAGIRSATMAYSLSATKTTDLSSAASEKVVKEMETKLTNLQDTLLRSGVMLGSLLIPAKVRKSLSIRVAANQSLISLTSRLDHGKNYTDAFMFLSLTDSWSNDDNMSDKNKGKNSKQQQNDDPKQRELIMAEDLVLKACVMELALDYCIRVATQVTFDLIDKLSDAELVSESVFSQLEDNVLRAVEAAEPYCVLIESCIQNDMEPANCRPPSCPFVDPMGCRYVSTCFEPEIQTEYANGLGLTTSATTTLKKSSTTSPSSTTTGQTDTTTETSSSSSVSSDAKKKKKKTESGWGLF